MSSVTLDTALMREVGERHVEATVCNAPFILTASKERPAFDGVCGHYEPHPLHDLYPDHSKRDPLYPPFVETDRHAYAPVGRGICAADEDNWPCAAARLAEPQTEGE